MWCHPGGNCECLAGRIQHNCCVRLFVLLYFHDWMTGKESVYIEIVFLGNTQPFSVSTFLFGCWNLSFKTQEKVTKQILMLLVFSKPISKSLSSHDINRLKRSHTTILKHCLYACPPSFNFKHLSWRVWKLHSKEPNPGSQLRVKSGREAGF